MKKIARILLSVFLLVALFSLPVTAATTGLWITEAAQVGDTVYVTISRSPDGPLSFYDATLLYDLGGLEYLGASPVSGLLSVSGGGGQVVMMAQGDMQTTAGTVATLSFRATSPGVYYVQVVSAADGDENLPDTGPVGVTVTGGGTPPTPLPTATPLPTRGPTPQPTIEEVTLSPPSTLPTEAAVTDPESGEEMETYYTFDGRSLVFSSEPIPDHLVPSGFSRETVDFSGTEAYTLRSRVLPRLYYMRDADGSDGLFYYWLSRDRFVPLLLVEGDRPQLMIVPVPDDVSLPDGFQETELDIEGVVVPALQPDSARFVSFLDPQGPLPDSLYLVYAKRASGVRLTPEEEAAHTEAEDEEEDLPEGETEESPEFVEDQGAFYFYDLESQLFFPYTGLLALIAETTPTPTPLPSPTPTPQPTVPLPAETVLVVDEGPMLNLFGYEYSLWKTIIFVLGFLLLLTWLLMLVRSLRRRDRDEEFAALTDPANWQRVPRQRPTDGEPDQPLYFDDRPVRRAPSEKRPLAADAPDRALAVEPASEPSIETGPVGEKTEEEERRERSRANLPSMPRLDSVRPLPVPPSRNERRTHADEMLIRPLPTAESLPTEEAGPGEAAAEAARPVIRRVELEVRKPKIRPGSGVTPVIDDDEHSEI